MSQARHRDRQSLQQGKTSFDLLLSKLLPPSVGPGAVPRSSLIERLMDGEGHPIVAIEAPAGYGKTTLLSQWAERDGKAFAWVSLDQADNDPKILLAYIAAALDEVEPLDERVFDALASPASSVAGSVIPRLSSAFWSMSLPVVLVLDDVHVLRNRECTSALSVLADHVPLGSRLALAGRSRPPLRMARLRAVGRITEIGSDDLSFTFGEALSMLHGASLSLADDEVNELYRRTEGWPAGLYLATLCLRQGGTARRGGASFAGDDRLVGEYVQSELLGVVSLRQRVFLTRTAVLERLCGPLCEAVIDLPGSGATLAELARSNLMLVPLDQRQDWYRYHHLLREMLLAELHRREPELVSALRQRAAAWCIKNDQPEEGLEYSISAGDVDTVAFLIGILGIPTYRQGRITTLKRWIDWLEERGGLEAKPMAAVIASLFFALTGHPVEAERWADAVDRWEGCHTARLVDPTAEAWAAVMRALLCRHGVEQMRADADEAASKIRETNFGTPIPQILRGIAQVLCGDLGGGEASLEDALVIAEQTSSSPEDVVIALCERALLAMARNEWERAESLGDEASEVMRRDRIDESVLTPLVGGIRARAALHRGDAAMARKWLVTAQRSRPVLTYALPYVAVQARIQLARVHLAVGDSVGARTLLTEIDELLRRRPGLGTLTGEAQALRTQLSNQRSAGAVGLSVLTAAELRLLPMLSSHLLMPEIAEELFLSRHTVKSQSRSLYRKLGASSRSEAVARARELGLLD